jgi:hypothetical protein
VARAAFSVNFGRRDAGEAREQRMYFVMTDRNNWLDLFPRHGAWAEVGVYRGDYSQKILDVCQPSELYLIDNWRFDLKEHNPFQDTAENFSGFSGKIHWDHFGDDPNATQEKNFEYVRSRFEQNQNVNIIRADSIKGIQSLPDRHFDVIYVDANHQYEYVLRDMVEAREKLKPGAIILLNDFYEGPGGAEQNLGVMGAVNTFVKRHDFHYVAMTLGSYADVALSDDPGSSYVRQFLENLKNSNYVFVGISDALVPNMRYKMYRKANGELRYVPML